MVHSISLIDVAFSVLYTASHDMIRTIVQVYTRRLNCIGRLSLKEEGSLQPKSHMESRIWHIKNYWFCRRLSAYWLSSRNERLNRRLPRVRNSGAYINGSTARLRKDFKPTTKDSLSRGFGIISFPRGDPVLHDALRDDLGV